MDDRSTLSRKYRSEVKSTVVTVCVTRAYARHVLDDLVEICDDHCLLPLLVGAVVGNGRHGYLSRPRSDLLFFKCLSVYTTIDKGRKGIGNVLYYNTKLSVFPLYWGVLCTSAA